MGTENIEVTILSAEKEINTFYSGGMKLVDAITSTVSYVAIVNIPNSRCEIKGTFKFKDTEFMDERWIRERIAGLFQGSEDCPC